MEKHAVSRLIGAPRDTWATKKVDSSPSKCGVILRGCALRRNRKSAPDVFNILLQIMDDGRSRRQSRKVDFKNTVIIMTSNLGSSYLQSENIRDAEGFERASKQ